MKDPVEGEAARGRMQRTRGEAGGGPGVLFAVCVESHDGDRRERVRPQSRSPKAQRQSRGRLPAGHAAGPP